MSACKSMSLNVIVTFMTLPPLYRMVLSTANGNAIRPDPWFRSERLLLLRCPVRRTPTRQVSSHLSSSFIYRLACSFMHRFARYQFISFRNIVLIESRNSISTNNINHRFVFRSRDANLRIWLVSHLPLISLHCRTKHADSLPRTR